MALKDTFQSAGEALSGPPVAGIPAPLVKMGVAAWLIVGAVIVLLIAAAFFVLTASISIPLILAAVIGAVSFPLAEKLQNRGWSSTAAAAAVLALLLVIIVVTGWIAVAGIVQQWPSLVAGIEQGIEELAATLQSYGWDSETFRATAGRAVSTDETAAAASGVLGDVLSSVAGGLSNVFGLFFGIFIAVTLLYYILNDFDDVMGWLGAHIGLPPALGQGVVEDGISSMRGYFKGTTLTGAVVAAVITAGCWILGVPLAIPIGLVTFVTCYIPFFGAIFSGAFAFLVALGSGGLTQAVAILIIVLITQNVLQTVISAKFMGESLSLHPIVVLVVTMLGGTLGGLLLAALAAPLTAMGVRTAARLRAYSEAGLIGDKDEPEPEPAVAGA